MSLESLEPVYKTDLGAAYCEDSLKVLKKFPDESIDLVLTSPPYALHFKKEYGNANQSEYLAWFMPFAAEIKRALKNSGSLVLNLGGAWTPSFPTRSLYVYKVLIALVEEIGFKFCQEFFWYNPAKMPAPAEWVNVRRIRVKDAVEYIFWLSKDEFPKANNKNVLQEYSPDMKRLIKNKVKKTTRPSGHMITEKFAQDHGGAIPPNILIMGNNESNSQYIKRSKKMEQGIHPARFPSELPEFFIKFLTNEDDIVVDPFAGSNTTGYVSESLNRRWVSVDIDENYVRNSQIRFTADTEEEPDNLISLFASNQ